MVGCTRQRVGSFLTIYDTLDSLLAYNRGYAIPYFAKEAPTEPPHVEITVPPLVTEEEAPLTDNGMTHEELH